MGTNTGTVMTLANSIIGVSVLAMPFCFKQCGIALSILMLILSSLVSRLACYFLLKAAHMARRRNFEFLAFHTFGSTGKVFVELCIIGFLMGTCIAFFVVVGDLGPVIIAKSLNINNTAALRPSVLIGLAAFVVLPLGLLRNVDSLGNICTATIVFYLCLVSKVVSESMPHLLRGDWLDEVSFWRPAGILQSIPIFSMALFCQTQLFEIYESLPNASLEKMNDVVRKAVNICTGVYICVGFFGYIAFCTQTFTGNVLMSFTPTLTSDLIKLGFVLSVAVSFPLVIFPCRASLYSLIFKRVQVSHHEVISTYIPEARFKCITVFIISISLAIGLLIPNIEIVLGLVGSTIGVIICVMFPAIVFIRISTKSTNDRLLAQAILFVGVLILVLGTYATLYAAQEADVEVQVNSESNLPLLNNLPIEIANGNPNPVHDSGAANPQQPKGLLEQKQIQDSVDMPDPVNKVKKKDTLDEKNPDVRQEPPVPMEPGPPVEEALSSVQLQKKVEVMAKDSAGNLVEEKALLPHNADVRGEKDEPKLNNEQVNQDAIKREDEELAEAEIQAKDEADNKHEEFLKKLAKHKEEQNKLLIEQKQILKELQENKIEFDREKKEGNKIIQGPNEVIDNISDKVKSNVENKLDTKTQDEIENEVQQPVENSQNVNARKTNLIGKPEMLGSIKVVETKFQNEVPDTQNNPSNGLMKNAVPLVYRQLDSNNQTAKMYLKSQKNSTGNQVMRDKDADESIRMKKLPLESRKLSSSHRDKNEVVYSSSPIIPLPLAVRSSSQLNNNPPKEDKIYVEGVAMENGALRKSKDTPEVESKMLAEEVNIKEEIDHNSKNMKVGISIDVGNNENIKPGRDILSSSNKTSSHEREKRDISGEDVTQIASLDIQGNCDAKDSAVNPDSKYINNSELSRHSINNPSSETHKENERNSNNMAQVTKTDSIPEMKDNSSVPNEDSDINAIVSEKNMSPNVPKNMTQITFNHTAHNSSALEVEKPKAIAVQNNPNDVTENIPSVTNINEDSSPILVPIIKMSQHLFEPDFSGKSANNLDTGSISVNDIVAKPKQRDLKSVSTDPVDGNNSEKKQEKTT